MTDTLRMLEQRIQSAKTTLHYIQAFKNERHTYYNHRTDDNQKRLKQAGRSLKVAEWKEVLELHLVRDTEQLAEIELDFSLVPEYWLEEAIAKSDTYLARPDDEAAYTAAQDAWRDVGRYQDVAGWAQALRFYLAGDTEQLAEIEFDFSLVSEDEIFDAIDKCTDYCYDSELTQANYEAAQIAWNRILSPQVVRWKEVLKHHLAGDMSRLEDMELDFSLVPEDRVQEAIATFDAYLARPDEGKAYSAAQTAWKRMPFLQGLAERKEILQLHLAGESERLAEMGLDFSRVPENMILDTIGIFDVFFAYPDGEYAPKVVEDAWQDVNWDKGRGLEYQEVVKWKEALEHHLAGDTSRLENMGLDFSLVPDNEIQKEISAFYRYLRRDSPNYEGVKASWELLPFVQGVGEQREVLENHFVGKLSEIEESNLYPDVPKGRILALMDDCSEFLKAPLFLFVNYHDPLEIWDSMSKYQQLAEWKVLLEDKKRFSYIDSSYRESMLEECLFYLKSRKQAFGRWDVLERAITRHEIYLENPSDANRHAVRIAVDAYIEFELPHEFASSRTQYELQASVDRNGILAEIILERLAKMDKDETISTQTVLDELVKIIAYIRSLGLTIKNEILLINIIIQEVFIWITVINLRDSQKSHST